MTEPQDQEQVAKDTPDQPVAPQAQRAAGDRLADSLERLEPTLTRLLTVVAQEHRSTGWWSLIKRTGIAAFAVLVLVVWLYFYGMALGIRPTIVKPTLAVVDLTGAIGSGHAASASNLVPLIDHLCAQRQVKALIIHIDSPGGSPTTAERIGAALERCQVYPTPARANVDGKPDGRPVLAVIDGLGASAAYLVAVHAQKIYASPESLVGSIGIIIEGFKFDKALTKVGVTPYAYASGDLKTALSPWQQDTPAQKALIEHLDQQAFEVFKKSVIAHRPQLVLNTPQLWSGRVWIAWRAQQIGLINGLGNLENIEQQDFPTLHVQTFRPQVDVRSLLSMRTWIKALRAEAEDHGLRLR